MIRLCVGFCLQLVTRRKMYFKMPPKFLFDIKPCPFSFCPLTSSKLSHQGKEVHHLCKYKVKDSLVLSLGEIILKLLRTSNIRTRQFFVQLVKFYWLIFRLKWRFEIWGMKTRIIIIVMENLWLKCSSESWEQ